MTKKTWVNVGGTFKEVNNVWQKVQGAWKEKVIPKGNISGAWKEFIQYLRMLYDHGVQLVPVSKVTIGDAGGTVTFNVDNVFLQCGNSSANNAVFSPDDQVDVTNFKKVKCLITKTSSTTSRPFRMGLKTVRDAKEASSGFVAHADFSAQYITPTEVELDISSLSGLYYLTIGQYYNAAGSGTVYVYKVWLE
ncbi:hypothetical protein MKY34_19585 [Sporosarcina sp. FSL K6-1522]|uniref:hypothetical protein n=1 Tax=Sporosarcina sp. FSL K6-1522 TaxID=2921554 RepID=UPI00315A1CAA